MSVQTKFFDIAYEMLGGLFSRTNFGSFRYGVFESNTPSGTNNEVEPRNLSVIFMCARILSGTVSMIPINVSKEGKPYKEHELFYKLRHKSSNNMSNQSLISTIEYQVCIYGNSFVDTRGSSYEIIPINIVDDWDYKGAGNSLRYHFDWGKDTEGNKRRRYPKRAEWVNAKHILHFKGLSADGVMGLPPVSAAMHNMKILDKATSTITHFYDNRAMSPMSLESKVDTAAGAKVTLEGLKTFNDKYSGTVNAGKAIQLPPNTKLTPLQIHFADAELVATMKFSKDEICNMYGIPSFMYNSSESVQMDIEQQSLNFKQFTVAPKIAMYADEFKFKLLKEEDIKNDISIKFDTSVLVETDLTSMANAYGKLIQNAIVTPAQAADKFGFEYDQEAPAMNWNFAQQQLIPLQMFDMHPAYQTMLNNKKVGDGINEKDKDIKTKDKKEKDEKTDDVD